RLLSSAASDVYKRQLVVVHPMTALGREMGLQEMTGFSKTAF
ncbi:DUF2810 domain-containing protein, partial [Escherichia sp. S69_ASV_4]|nr:DUF2810 domain-containing protein [Escherichia sp. S69_ASV_4]